MAKEYKWCAVDAEGDSGETGLLGAAIYSDKVQRYITDKSEIIKELVYHAQEGYTFLCHNAEYDIPVLFWQLKIPVRRIAFNGRFNRGEWKINAKAPAVQIWDTVGLSGGLSLADLGKAIGIHKYNTPQKLRGIDPDRYEWVCDKHNTGECESCYAIRDAEIVYRFMVELSRLLNGWGIEPQRRIAGISIAAWKVFDKPKPIAIKDPRINRLGRAAYAGGRCETFKLGYIKNVYAADICSAYPAAMLETLYPDPTCMVYDENKKPEQVNWELEGVAKVRIQVPFSYLPVLHHTSEGIRKYPCGVFTGTFTFMELRYALSLGCTIIMVEKMAYSTRQVRPFVDTIKILWELRAAYESIGDPRSFFAKLLMNNLYGRIGMKSSMTRDDTFMAPPGTGSKDWKGLNWDKIGDEYYLTEKKKQKARNQYANVLWAAQTTAAVRIKLHKFLSLQGTNILYTDTDSVFSTQPINGLGEGLGALRDQVEYEAMIISYPKVYALQEYKHNMPESWWTEPCEKHRVKACETCRWKAKAKGVSRDVAWDFLRNGVATFRKPIKIREQGRYGQLAGTWVEVTRSQQVTDHRRHPINPIALQMEYGWSDTAPPMEGPPQSIASLR